MNKVKQTLAFLVLALFLSALPGLAQEEPGEEVVLGSRAGFELSVETAETIQLEEGARLRQQPDLRSLEVVSLPEPMELPVVERKGSWVRVVYGHQRGWTLVKEGPESLSPRSDLALLVPTAEELAEVKSHLGSEGREATLGPYGLLTDLPWGEGLASLDSLARQLGEAYSERYGLELVPPRGEWVALFSKESQFRAFAASKPELDGLTPHGFAGNGLAVLVLDSLPSEASQMLLIHELTHLNNRRAFGSGDQLPPWLDEGLAEDLAYSELTSTGKLRLGSLASRASIHQVVGDRPGVLTGRAVLTTAGPRVHLERLAQVFGSESCPSLATLFSLTSLELSQPEKRQLLYSMAGFLVRYLLDGSGGKRAANFRSFLAALSRGGSGEPAVLLGALDLTLPELESGFVAWLRLQTHRDRPVRP